MWILFTVLLFLKCGHSAIIQNELIIWINQKDWISKDIALIPQDTDTVENTVERKTKRTRS